MKAPNLKIILRWHLSLTIIILAIVPGLCFSANVQAQQSAQASSGRPELALQVGHRGFIYRVAVSPDGRTAASLSYDGTLKIWDALTGDLLDTFAFPHGQDIGFQSDKMVFSADGRVIEFLKLDWSADHKITKLYEFNVKNRVFRQFESNPTINDLRDTQLREPNRTLIGRKYFSHSPDGRTILLIKSTEEDAVATLELWDEQLSTLKQTLTGNLPAFLDPIYSSDGRLMALATESKFADRADSAEIILYDLQVGKIIGRLPCGLISSDKIAFSRDGATLTTLNWRSEAKLWETKTGVLKSGLSLSKSSLSLSLSLAQHRPKEVAFSADGQVIVSGGDDGGVVIWNFRTGQIIRTVVFPQNVTHPSFLADDRAIIQAEPGLPAMAWDLQDLQARPYARDDSDKKSENAYKVSSPDGRLSVRLNSDGKSATLYETQTGKTLATLAGHAGAITSVLFAPDGLSVATVSGLPALNGASKAMLAIAFAFAGDKKAEFDTEVGKLTGDGTIRIWDARTGLIKHPLQGDGAIHEARILPDGSAIVATHSGRARTEEMLAGPNSYTLWDVQTGKAIKTVLAEGDGSYRLSSDGSLVIFSGREKLQALDVRTGALKWENSEAEISPLGNPFSPDGHYLLVDTKYMSTSTAIKLLDLQTGRARWAYPDNGLTSFSPDGRTVVCYDANKASFLDLETGRLKWSIGYPVTYNFESPLLPGGNLAATFGRHYAIELRDARDGRLLVSLLNLPGTGRPNDKGESTPEWLAFTPEGYYSASPGAARYIRWRVGDKLLPAEAYAGEFNRPELVRKALQSN